MPIQVYSFNLRVAGHYGSARLPDKETAEKVYNELAADLASGSEFITIIEGDSKHSVRAKDVQSFGINVHLEQTPEEIKAAQIAAIENGHYGQALDSGYAQKACLNSASGGLLRGY